MPVRYLIGDATKPVGSDTKVICHCVNDQGQWGSGFVLAISARWPHVEQHYREWHATGSSSLVVDLNPGPSDVVAYFHLGSVQFVQVESRLWVANIIGQHKTIREEAVPVRYDALEFGFTKVAEFCNVRQASAHMPRIGAGLARGKWAQIAKIIEAKVVGNGISATVYDLP